MDKDWLLLVVVFVDGSVGVLMRFEWRSLCVGRGVLGWRWVCVWGRSGWVSEFWTNSGGTVYTLILTISMSIVCLTQFG